MNDKNNSQFSINNSQLSEPTADNPQLTTDNQLPTSNNPQPTTNDSQPTTNIPPIPTALPSTNNQQPTAPAVDNTPPTTNSQQPTTHISSFLLIPPVVVIALVGAFLLYKNFIVKKPATNSSTLPISTKTITPTLNQYESVSPINTDTPTSADEQELSKAQKCYNKTTCSSAGCMTNPASTFCICMGGVSEIKETESGQRGFCTINTKEYDEWEYYQMMTPNEPG